MKKIRHIKVIAVLILILGFIACQNSEQNIKYSGRYSGVFEYGNFTDEISFHIEKDNAQFKVFFSSTAQNANRIPFQGVEVNGDSIHFFLQSDFYKYAFKNKWTDRATKLRGVLTVDGVSVPFVLKRQDELKNGIQNEEVSFQSSGLKINGTIYDPLQPSQKALVILTSSMNADRSSSRSEAVYFAKKGFTTFHYDKRGTGNSEGNWQIATMEQLVADDVQAITYFSEKANIPLNRIGIMGGSQGATKVPQVLNELSQLYYGVLVSCPASTLLESDLNHWKNRNAEVLGDNLVEALAFQRKVFQFMAGMLPKEDLEKEIATARQAQWFEQVWVPDLNHSNTDPKLLYSPMPFLAETKQPLLIIQGGKDEIIPEESHVSIQNVLKNSGNEQFKVKIIKDASHSMSYVGESDFPYWTKLHPEYFSTIQDWIDSNFK